MIPAPVGFRCPECVKEQSAGGSRAKVVTRAQVRSRWSGATIGAPAGLSATKVLMALNVIVFVLELVTGYSGLLGGGSGTVDLGGLAPIQVFLGHDYWRMFTTMFLHGGLIHLAFNMWALWAIGGFIEAAVGRLKFVIIYFVSGLAGSVMVLLAAPANVTVVGASGAIFGLFGALAVHAFVNRGRDFQSRALLGNVLFLLVINLMFSFRGGISWQAHIGGLVAGAAVMAAMMLAGRKDPRRPFELPDGLAVLGIVFVLVALTWWSVLTFTL
jgi:membrane associated rhomboid family serine protease